MDIASVAAIFGVLANFATAIGFFALAWQVKLSRDNVRAQTRTAELQIFADLNLKFLDVISQFSENVNKKDVKVHELSEQERRALDRWFYLANMEYMVSNKKLLDGALLKQWSEGIASAAKKPIFLERWRTTASNFRVDPGFKKIFDDAAAAERASSAHS